MRAIDLIRQERLQPESYLDVFFNRGVLLLQRPNGNIRSGVLVWCQSHDVPDDPIVYLIYVHPLYLLDGKPEIVEHKVGGPHVRDDGSFIKASFKHELIYSQLVSG